MARTRKTKLTTLKPDPKNARRHDDRNREAIRKSLDRFGPGRSVVIDGDDTIRAGNGTVAEAIEAGFEEVLVVEPGPKQLVAVRRPDWTEEEARAYGVADNRSSDLSDFDPAQLDEVLKSVGDIDLGDMGFNEKELVTFLANKGERGVRASDVDPYAEWDGMPEYDHEDKSGRSIVLRFKDDEAVQQFAKAIGLKITEGVRTIWYPEMEIETYIDKRYESEK
jgi:hypothetical protein